MMWLMLAVSYFCLGRAAEMFAHTDGKIHEDFGVTLGDVPIFCGMVQQLQATELRRWADRVDGVELLFRGSKKGDQKRYGEVVSRKKTMVGASGFDWNSVPPPISIFEGGARWILYEVMLELLMLYPSLDVRSPMAAYVRRQE